MTQETKDKYGVTDDGEVYDGVKESQVQWYRDKHDALTAEYGLFKSVTVVHIPPYQVEGNYENTHFAYGEKREGVATAVERVEDSDDILLAKGPTIGQIADVVAHMGYEISSDDLAKVHKAFEQLAERKAVSGKELETIVANVADEVPPTYILRSYIVNSGDRISPMAQVEIEKDGEVRHGVSIGNGPIDAAFLAVEKVIGSTYELDDFRISSVTRGQEAMGEALVRLRSRGKVYSGSGVSTDIIGASLRAYVNALNKIVFEEQ